MVSVLKAPSSKELGKSYFFKITTAKNYPALKQ